jgi:hypothetical protein
VVLRGVEVDVVGDLERQEQAHIRGRQQVRLDRRALPVVMKQVGQPGAHRLPHRTAEGHERVERRLSQHRLVEHVAHRGPGHRRQVEHQVADGHADPRVAAG